MGIVEKLIPGTDGVMRGAKIRIGETELGRAAQHLYPLELACDITEVEETVKLNADVPAFIPRGTRRAAAEARDRIAAIAYEERE